MYGRHVVEVVKKPYYLSMNKRFVDAYLLVHDPVHVRLVTSLRDPVDRAASLVGMYNTRYPGMQTPFQTMGGVLLVGQATQKCMAKFLCVYCGTTLTPMRCASDEEVADSGKTCAVDEVMAVYKKYVRKPQRQVFDDLPLHVVMRMLSCQFRGPIADMGALQIRKWLSLFGAGQLQVVRHSAMVEQDAW